MGFKLVKIDGENHFKIKVESGTHIFGRGKFLGVNDKRISRQHGQFEVTDDSLIITSLHPNPCFYQKNGSSQVEILKQSNSVSLSSGDKLGLLPNSYWYQVLKCMLMNSDGDKKADEECQENTTEGIIIESGEETDNETEPRIDSVRNTNVGNEKDKIDKQSTEVLSSSQTDNIPNSNHMNLDKETCETQNFESDKAHPEETVSDSLAIKQEIEDTSNQTGSSTSNVFSSLSAPQKRPHSVCEDGQTDEIKKIKTEAEDKPDVKTAPDSQQAGSSISNNNVNVNPPQAAPLRERCMYGASCYRRNPVHRAQFSHPQDIDWGTGEKAPCPWGAACGKRDPRHWRDHDHPPGKEQPPPQPGMRVVHRQGNVFYINAHTVNFHDDHFEAEDSDGNSVDYDYEF